MTRVAWGKGKLEVFALKGELLDLFAKGATIEEAYHAFSDRVSVCKPTFRRHASAIRKAAGAYPTRKPAKALALRKPAEPLKPEVEGRFSLEAKASDKRHW